MVWNNTKSVVMKPKSDLAGYDDYFDDLNSHCKLSWF